MKRLLILAPSILALAACSRAPANFQPGQWEMAMAVTGVDAPGLPPEAQTQLRGLMNRPETSRECMSADQAANPLRDLRAGMRQGMSGMGGQLNCEFANNDNFSGGTIRITATCRPPSGPGQARLLMEGGYTATSMDARFTWTFEGPNPQGGTQTARLSGTARGRRLGDCPR
jgi:hypothetical protein